MISWMTVRAVKDSQFKLVKRINEAFKGVRISQFN